MMNVEKVRLPAFLVVFLSPGLLFGWWKPSAKEGLFIIGFFMLIYGPKKANVYGNSKAVKQQMKEYEKVIRDQKREQRKLKRTAGKEE